MNQPFEIFPGFVPEKDIESIIKETYAFKQAFYNEENLARHAAYLSDKLPNRQSHAYATGMYYEGDLPYIDLYNTSHFERLVNLHRRAIEALGLTMHARTLFNVQEYFAASERVPRHNDGELLEFSADEYGTLDIKRSIRPEKVAVLTLVNDTDGQVGTRLFLKDGDDFVIQAKAGDLLIFDNVNNFHGVDPLTGTVKREDGLLRMIIGWRSLNENTAYAADGIVVPITTAEAERIIGDWYKNEWPSQWVKIQKSLQKAAF